MVLNRSISPPIKIVLQFMGVWPDMQYAFVSKVIIAPTWLILQYYQYMNVIVQCKLGDVQNLIDSLPTTIYFSLTAIKFMVFWTNHRVFREILASMEMDWSECVNVDRHLQVMTAKASISHFLSNILFGFNLIFALFYLCSDNAVVILHHLTGVNDTSRPFPIATDFPFDYDRSPIYEFIVIALFLQGLVNTCLITAVSLLIFTLVVHASGQIDIIREGLKRVSEEVSYSKISGYTIKVLVQRHHKVIEFSKNINTLFSLIALAQAFLNTLVICAQGLFLVTSVDEIGFMMLKIVLGYCVVMSEIFIYCFLGEFLTLKSKSLADAAYNSLWYNTSSKQSRDLLFIIMRSQKPLTISAGGIKNLSLEVFASIIKASASYVSVLHAMY